MNMIPAFAVAPTHSNTQTDAARATAARLRHWLLHGPAQLHRGDQRGGVAGLIDANGKPRYVYAEITGYYLSWLADVAGPDDMIARERAHLAVDWAKRAFARSGQTPQTRIYLEAVEPDWRNNAVFFFDLAMLLRGLDAADEAGIAMPGQTLRATLHEQLSNFVHDDVLKAAIQLRGTQTLPPRWSTLGGPFLVKASSRVAYGGRHHSLPPALARACERDSANWSPAAGDIDLGMLHPTLYFAEGLLLSRPDRADAVAQLLQRCLDLTHADGSLPESVDPDPVDQNLADQNQVNGSPRVRNDILAQALRVGILVRELGAKSAPAQSALDRLAETLLQRIGDGEFLVFNADSAGQANVWATMFAEQALRWYSSSASDRRPSAAALV